MKARAVFLIIASACLGLVAVVLVRGTLARPEPSAAPDLRKVVVASTPLNFGDQLTPNNLREATFLLASIPEGAFGTVAELTTGEPRVALASIQTGVPILAAQISGKGAKASLSSIIDPGKRAIAIRVDDVSGAAGFITPSDRVDIMLTRTGEGKTTPGTEVLLQNIKVLAVDQQANEHVDRPTVVKAVTLEVTPTEAEKIALGRTIGALSLSLRNAINAGPIDIRPISLGDLVGLPPATPPAPDPVIPVEIIRGSVLRK